MALEPFAPDVWTVASHLPMPGGVRFPLRCVVIRLPDGGLWLHSPVPFDEETAAAIDDLGPVRHLVAPSKLHHLFVADAIARWPVATLWGTPGLADKRDDLPFAATLATEGMPWADTLHTRVVDGVPLVSETVFLHRPTGTLVCTDLVFHFQQANWQTRWLLWLVGAWDKLTMSLSWRFMTRDRAALGDAVRDVLDWPVERILMAHGTPVTDAAKERLETGLAWAAAGRAKRLEG